jgi:DNA-binding MarR family transcriptional regulator
VSVFNLDNQNANLDKKIMAGLERLSQVFKILLWEKAKEQGLSPIQLQLLIFIHHHSQEKSTVSYLAQEFNLTKPTISDAIKVLEEKKIIKKVPDSIDTRSYTIQLMASGRKVVAETENFVDPITKLISSTPEADKSVLWESIASLIKKLNELDIISVQRTCYACKHYEQKGKVSFCNLLNQRLQTNDIRIDCPEFDLAV